MPKCEDNNISVDKVAAIIITYFFDESFSERIQILLNQVSLIVIVDNSAHSSTDTTLDQLALNKKIVVLKNKENLGIGTALNQGVTYCESNHFEWTLLLDQDSVVDENIIQELLSIIDFYPSKTQIGIIGANYRSKYSQKIFVPIKKENYKEVKAVITSGSLLSISAYRSAGPFREDFFIEGVDLEYCLRLRSHNYKILISKQPLMTHGAGKMEEHNFLGRIVVVTHHEPYRYYYMVRNVLLMMPKYFLSEPRWFMSSLINLFKLLIKILLYEEKKLSKIKHFILGVWDSIFVKHRVFQK